MTFGTWPWVPTASGRSTRGAHRGRWCCDDRARPSRADRTTAKPRNLRSSMCGSCTTAWDILARLSSPAHSMRRRARRWRSARNGSRLQLAFAEDRSRRQPRRDCRPAVPHMVDTATRFGAAGVLKEERGTDRGTVFLLSRCDGVLRRLHLTMRTVVETYLDDVQEETTLENVRKEEMRVAAAMDSLACASGFFNVATTSELQSPRPIRSDV